jgi:hypothetical protein
MAVTLGDARDDGGGQRGLDGRRGSEIQHKEGAERDFPRSDQSTKNTTCDFFDEVIIRHSTSHIAWLSVTVWTGKTPDSAVMTTRAGK